MPITRNEGESLKDWFSRIVETEMDAGKPQDQALAIAYRTTGTGRVGGKTKKCMFSKGEARTWVTIRGKRVPIKPTTGVKRPGMLPSPAWQLEERQEIAPAGHTVYYATARHGGVKYGTGIELSAREARASARGKAERQWHNEQLKATRGQASASRKEDTAAWKDRLQALVAPLSSAYRRAEAEGKTQEAERIKAQAFKWREAFNATPAQRKKFEAFVSTLEGEWGEGIGTGTPTRKVVTIRVLRKAQKMVRVRVIRKQGEAQRWITVRGRRVRLADRKGKTPDLQHKTYYVPENASPQLRASIRRKQAEEDARYDAVMAAFKPPQSRMTA